MHKIKMVWYENYVSESLQVENCSRFDSVWSMYTVG